MFNRYIFAFTIVGFVVTWWMIFQNMTLDIVWIRILYSYVGCQKMGVIKMCLHLFRFSWL